MNYTKKDILKALSQVIEPELKKDMVSLNMIKDVEVNGNDVSFAIELTTPACPMKQQISDMCEKAVREQVDEKLNIKIELTSRVRGAENLKDILPGVKNIIGVASGKGGVGKSTVASNLAIALAKTGAKVGIIDADIYGPSMPIMFNLKDAKPSVYKTEKGNEIIPPEKYGVKVLSIGFFVEQDKALVWRGPMAGGALKQLFTEANWGELDYLVLDLPPGTGDIQLTIVQTVPLTGVVVVTTPQNIALADAEKGINMFRNDDINVPVLGLVENMAYFTPEELPDNKYYIFGKDGGKSLAKKYNVPLLAEIPIVQGICEGADKGEPIVLNDDNPTANAFMDLARNTASAVSIRNIMSPKTNVVNVS